MSSRRCRDEDILKLGNSLFHKIGKGESRLINSKNGVEVGSSEIGIDEDRPYPQFRQTDSDVGSDKTLPAPSLAPSDGPDHFPLARPILPHPAPSY